MRITFITTLILFLFSILALADDASRGSQPISPEEYRILMDIGKSFAEIGTRYKKSPEEIQQLYRKAILTADTIPKYGKGSVSILREDIYIVNNQKSNELILGGKEWVSSLGNSPELVIIAGRKVLGTFPISTLPSKDDFIFVLFNGDQAKYFDWKTLTGAVTYRH